MNPLSTFKYIKSNFMKALPVLISTIVSVLLIYLFILITKSTNKMVNITATNFFKKYTIMSSNNEDPIPKDYLDRINKDDNVAHIIPLISDSGYLNYAGLMGTMTITTLNFYENDIPEIINTLDINLIQGALPIENRDEIIIPKKYALQYKLKVGDYIGSEVSSSYGVKGKLKISGITDGPVMLAMISDNKLNIPRDKVINRSLLFSVKNVKNKNLINYLSENTPKNILIVDFYSISSQLIDLLNSLDAVSYLLTIIIIFVMCISLGNLNYINFVNRKYEFGVLSAIGYKKSSLYFKLWKENSFVCLIGYIGGIIITTLVAFLLNTIVLLPNGKFIPLWNTSGIIISLCIPVFVSILSIIAPIKELRKTEPLDVIGGVI